MVVVCCKHSEPEISLFVLSCCLHKLVLRSPPQINIKNGEKEESVYCEFQETLICFQISRNMGKHKLGPSENVFALFKYILITSTTVKRH